MIEYIVKSSIILIFSYLIYLIFLKNNKSFNFNRAFLLVSVLLSIIIPFIRLQFSLGIIEKMHVANLVKIADMVNFDTAGSTITFQYFLVVVYGLVSIIFLIRLLINLLRLIVEIQSGEKTKFLNCNLILVTKKIVPFTFFRHVFVNKSEFKKGLIADELIRHESIHSFQLHSIDILIIEFVKVIYWFNPVIWLMRHAMQLNHEYIADKGAIKNGRHLDYRDKLLQCVYNENTMCLISSFNSSLTKKRLMMMSKTVKSQKSYLNNFLGLVMLVLIMALTSLDTVENMDVKGRKTFSKTESGLQNCSSEVSCKKNSMTRIVNSEKISSCNE